MLSPTKRSLLERASLASKEAVQIDESGRIGDACEAYAHACMLIKELLSAYELDLIEESTIQSQHSYNESLKNKKNKKNKKNNKSKDPEPTPQTSRLTIEQVVELQQRYPEYLARIKVLRARKASAETLPTVVAQGIAVVTQAISLDVPDSHPVAFKLYMNGIELLMQGLDASVSPTTKSILEKRISVYMKRAEQLREIMAMRKKPTLTSTDDEHNIPPPSAPPLCVVCLDGEVSSCFIPCGHSATCEECAEHVLQIDSSCVICRSHVDSVTRIYISSGNTL